MPYNVRFENISSEEIERRVREIDPRASTSLKSVPNPEHDPILATVFTTLFSQMGVSGAIFGVSTASILGGATAALVMTASTPGICAL